MGQDGEEFLLSWGYKSANDSCEMFSLSDESGKENFPGNDVDEFLNYVEDDDSGDNIPPNGDETTFTKDDGMRSRCKKILKLGVGVDLFMSI